VFITHIGGAAHPTFLHLPATFLGERPIHLRAALDAMLSWQRGGTSPEIAKLYFSLGSALLAAVRAAGREVHAGGSGDLREVESLFSKAYAHSCTCFGQDSSASQQAGAAVRKAQQLLGSSSETPIAEVLAGCAGTGTPIERSDHHGSAHGARKMDACTPPQPSTPPKQRTAQMSLEDLD
jgi:hypothetical protein